MKVLQINTVGNIGSTGRIAEQIGISALNNGLGSYIACGIRIRESRSKIIKIGKEWHRYPNVAWTRIFDTDSPLAKYSTLKFIDEVVKISPDIIHLHNLHGYYLHTPTLLKFLGKYDKPVVWTLHDLWPFTGHCCYFDSVNCTKWQTHCSNCPLRKGYPASFVFDNSSKNHTEKIELILAIKNLTFVPVSNWVGNLVKQSLLKNKNVEVIRNGVDLNVFTSISSSEKKEKKIALFVANVWGERKGFQFIPKIADLLGDKWKCVVVGVNKNQKQELEKYGIIAIQRTESAKELAKLYSQADVYVNPTRMETLSMTNVEAQACGTPVVTFDAGGTPETISSETGIVVPQGNIEKLAVSIKNLADKEKSSTSSKCIEFAKNNFDSNKVFEKYINLYKKC